MKHHVFVRPAAHRDIRDHADYLVKAQSLQMGLRLYAAAAATFKLLASQPEMGKRAEFRSSFLQGMRMFPIKRFPNHLVFYRSGKDGIEIMRVLHGARDIEAVFEPDEGGGEDPLIPDLSDEVF